MGTLNTRGTLLLLLISYVVLDIQQASALFLKTDISAQEIAKMHTYMNKTISPCENFYEYSCGSWLKSHANEIKDPMNTLDQIYNEKLENLLNKDNLTEEPNELMEKLKIFYKSCEQQQNYEISSYMEIMRPMVNETWPQDNQSWQPANEWNVWQTLGDLAGIGFGDLFFSLSWNKENTTVYQLALRQCNTFKFAKTIGNVSESVAQFLKQLNDLCDQYKKQDPIYMSISELQKELPNIDFHSYFSSLFNNTALPLDTLSIMVDNMPYYQQLGTTVNGTSEDTLIHTMKYLLQQYFAEILPKDCISTMRDVLALALNVVYEKYEYHQQKAATDKIVQQIFRNLQSEFFKLLKQQSHEFSPTEQIFLYDKIIKMHLNIGNLQLLEDSEFYVKYYQNWIVETHQFYDNHLNALRHKTLEILGVSSFLLDFSQSFENSLQVFYPFFLFSKNVIVIPFQYLSYPEFQPEFNELLLYGDLGYSMAHAMMYGFSTFGLQYNAAGERNTSFAESLLNKSPLWDAINCINATNSIELDIKMTDFIGFRLAYDTYFNGSRILENSLDSVLTDRQLFYLRYAQSECIVRRLPTYTGLPVAMQNLVENNRDFEEVFQCATEIGPKCEIW